MRSSSNLTGVSRLRPSAVEGWRAVTRQLAAIPHESVATAVARLKVSYATAGLDYAEAQAILETMGPAKESAIASYQALIEHEAMLRPAEGGGCATPSRLTLASASGVLAPLTINRRST